MTDQELFNKYAAYARDHGWTSEEAAKQIGVGRATFFNWKNGKQISPKGRKAMRIMIAVPVEPSAVNLTGTDHLTNYLLDEWKNLTGSEKAEVISLIEHIKARKQSNGTHN